MNTTRKLGWLATASLLGAALIAPSASLAASVTPTQIDAQGAQATCQDLGFDSGFKIDSGELKDGTFGPVGFNVDVDFSGDDGGLPTSFDFTVPDGNALVNGVFVKAGTVGWLYNYGAGTDGDTDLTAADGKGISHVLFCYNEVEEESESVPVESEEVSIPVESESVPVESEEVSIPVESEEISNEPSGSVQAETGTPEEEATPPSTDTIANPNTASSNGWQLVLLGLGALMATALILTPARARR